MDKNFIKQIKKLCCDLSGKMDFVLINKVELGYLIYRLTREVFELRDKIEDQNNLIESLKNDIEYLQNENINYSVENTKLKENKK